MFPRLRSFLTALTYRERFEDSLDEEVRFHLNAQTEDLASPRWGPAGGSGAPPEGAVRQHQSYEGRLPTGARPAGHGRAATEHPPDGLHGNPGTTPGCRPGRALPRTRESARWAPGGGGAASGSGPRRLAKITWRLLEICAILESRGKCSHTGDTGEVRRAGCIAQREDTTALGCGGGTGARARWNRAGGRGDGTVENHDRRRLAGTRRRAGRRGRFGPVAQSGRRPQVAAGS